ncbi:MAG: hydroxyacid dehydrogenase [Bacteroidetes bacterium]|nr:hydroxyacid dehydrogenase [Bacteroidota bacterium]
MRLLHLEPERYGPGLRQKLAARCRVDYKPLKDKKGLLQALAAEEYEALIVSIGIPIDQEVFDAARSLKYIVSPTTGLNHIDMETAHSRRIKVISLKGESDFLANIQSTSELTWGLLLSLIRQIPAAAESVNDGNWHRERFLGMELNGHTLGILGYGRLGRIVAGYGLAFGMKVVVCDTNAAQVENLPDGIQATDLKTLLAESDVLSLHIDYKAENHHFISEEVLQQTKPGLILLNTARGEVVDEAALLKYLKSGHLKGAALDVLEGDSSWEGKVGPHPLIEYSREHKNLLISPHIGGYAWESIYRTRSFIIDKFFEVLENTSHES